MNDRAFTVAQAAEQFGVTPATMLDWIEQKKVNAVRLGGGAKGGRLRVYESEIERLKKVWSTAAPEPQQLERVK